MSWLAFLGLALGVHGGHTQSFDLYWRGVVHSWSSPARTEFMHDATQLGAIIALSMLSVGVIFGFLFLKLKRAALLMASNMIGAGLFNDSLKALFHRARPNPFFGIPPPGDYSFPSGHSLCSFCFYGMIAALFVARIRNRAARVAVVMAAALIIFSVGMSRVYLGVHYPTDVLGGWTLALSWISFLLIFDTREQPQVDECLTMETRDTENSLEAIDSAQMAPKPFPGR
jgi:membrane-associated phospholipid phosphatase